MALHSSQTRPGQRTPPAKAFTLVEVVLAVGIVSFAILSMVALLPVGLENEQTSSDEMLALNGMRTLAADLANTGTSATESVRFHTPLPNAITSATNVELYLDDSEKAVPPPGKALFHVNLSYFPATTSPKSPAAVLIQVKWPAYAPNPKSFVESYITFPKS
ncbi:MAG: hypothetical protein ACFUZC_15840 [Chthoniobacteraceae bacterium]